jgi:hypothetical protein
MIWKKTKTGYKRVIIEIIIIAMGGKITTVILAAGWWTFSQAQYLAN